MANFGIKLNGSSGLDNLGYTTLYSDVAILVLYPSMVLYWLIYAASIIKSRKEYMSGSYSELSKAITTRKNIFTVISALLVLTIVALPAVFLSGKTEIDQKDALLYKGEHPALLRNVFPDEWEFAEKRIRLTFSWKSLRKSKSCN